MRSNLIYAKELTACDSVMAKKLSEAQPITFPEFPLNLDHFLSHSNNALHNLVPTMATLVCSGHTMMVKPVCYTLRFEGRILRESQHYRGNEHSPRRSMRCSTA